MEILDNSTTVNRTLESFNSNCNLIGEVLLEIVVIPILKTNYYLKEKEA